MQPPAPACLPLPPWLTTTCPPGPPLPDQGPNRTTLELGSHRALFTGRGDSREQRRSWQHAEDAQAALRASIEAVLRQLYDKHSEVRVLGGVAGVGALKHVPWPGLSGEGPQEPPQEGPHEPPHPWPHASPPPPSRSLQVPFVAQYRKEACGELLALRGKDEPLTTDTEHIAPDCPAGTIRVRRGGSGSGRGRAGGRQAGRSGLSLRGCAQGLRLLLLPLPLTHLASGTSRSRASLPPARRPASCPAAGAPPARAALRRAVDGAGAGAALARAAGAPAAAYAEEGLVGPLQLSCMHGCRLCALHPCMRMHAPDQRPN